MSDPTTKHELANKIALVTGGSSGIGAASVTALAQQGAKVIIGYHRGEFRAHALCESLPGDGHQIMQLPLEDAQAHDAAARRIEEEYGRLDILVNSAGYTQRIPHNDLTTMTSALFNEILLANVGGPYSITRALMPLLRASGDAVVINISSVSAFTGLGSNIAYCAAKAGLDIMTKSLARACGHGIRYLCVSPAAVDTGFVAGRSHAEMSAKAAQTPLGRIITPEDVAQTVLACVTHLRTSTGTRIVIDGGHSL